MAMDRWGPSVSLFDLPLHRLVNWLTFKAFELVEWDEDGKNRAELESILEWSEISEAAELERADANARAALHGMGIPMPMPWQPPDGYDQAEADR